MDQLKKLGQICRQNYEKLILVLALILMGLAVWYIYEQSQAEREFIEKIPTNFETRKVKGVSPADLTQIQAALQAATNPPALTLGGKHNLFNPVTWLQYPGKPIIKNQSGQEVGVAKMQVVEIRPLVLSIAYDRAAASGTGDQAKPGYHTVVTNDLATVSFRRRVPQFVTVGDTNKQVFVITEVKGPAENPTELVVRLKDLGGETASFAPGKPYVRVVGYEADLKYSITGASFPNKRKDMPIVIEGESYKIVDITQTKVVLSDDSNGKRYTIEHTTTP